MTKQLGLGLLVRGLPTWISYSLWISWISIFRQTVYVLLALISFCFNKPFSIQNSGCTGPIFTKCSPYGRYLIVDYRSDLVFPMAQETLLWQPILGSKLAKSDYSVHSPLFLALASRNRLQYRRSDFKKFICDDLHTIYVNLVNFGPETPEFT